jgi:hypothetical protein
LRTDQWLRADDAVPTIIGTHDRRSPATQAIRHRERRLDTERLYAATDEILGSAPIDAAYGMEIGRSREGRSVRGFQFGRGDFRVSLLGGCHADEPVGPRLLRRLAGWLSRLPGDDPTLARHEWWVLPHINPDGAERNRGWQAGDPPAYDPVEYLAGSMREPPGDDIEFGFPRGVEDDGARPENRAAYDWWRGAGGPFDLHVSLHGMAFAAGPWFLIEPAWRDRCELLKDRCRDRVRDLGYVLHDVERDGEKGFFRIERGFCTRPDSRFMAEHFRGRGDEETARLFRPSSMETVRSLGGDPLTLVSEMPLFITPGVGEELGPPDPAAEEWKRRTEGWRRSLRDAGRRGREHEQQQHEQEQGRGRERVRSEIEGSDLRPMPVRDQMALQWAFIVAGIEQARAES